MKSVLVGILAGTLLIFAPLMLVFLALVWLMQKDHTQGITQIHEQYGNQTFELVTHVEEEALEADEIDQAVRSNGNVVRFPRR